MAREAGLTALLQFTGILTNVLDPNTTPRPKVTHESKNSLKLLTGNGQNQVNRIWCKEKQAIADAANFDISLLDFNGIDIGAGPGLDALGQPMLLTHLVALLIVNRGPGRLDIGGEGGANAFKQLFIGMAANPETGVISIPAGGSLFVTAPVDGYPIAVADAILRLAANGGAVDCDIFVAGRAA